MIELLGIIGIIAFALGMFKNPAKTLQGLLNLLVALFFLGIIGYALLYFIAIAASS